MKNQMPPARSGAYRDWVKIAERLRRSPGKWVLIGEGMSRYVAANIRRGYVRALKSDDEWTYTATCRNTSKDKRTADVYMMASRTEKEG